MEGHEQDMKVKNILLDSGDIKQQQMMEQSGCQNQREGLIIFNSNTFQRVLVLENIGLGTLRETRDLGSESAYRQMTVQ